MAKFKPSRRFVSPNTEHLTYSFGTDTVEKSTRGELRSMPDATKQVDNPVGKAERSGERTAQAGPVPVAAPPNPPPTSVPETKDGASEKGAKGAPAPASVSSAGSGGSSSVIVRKSSDGAPHIMKSTTPRHIPHARGGGGGRGRSSYYGQGAAHSPYATSPSIRGGRGGYSPRHAGGRYPGPRQQWYGDQPYRNHSPSNGSNLSQSPGQYGNEQRGYQYSGGTGHVGGRMGGRDASSSRFGGGMSGGSYSHGSAVHHAPPPPPPPSKQHGQPSGTVGAPNPQQPQQGQVGQQAGQRAASSPLQQAEGWQYKDPEEQVHGPFSASKIVNWVDKGYFSEGLPVRRVTKGGEGAWVLLKVVMIDLRREAAQGVGDMPAPDVAAKPSPAAKPDAGTGSPSAGAGSSAGTETGASPGGKEAMNQKTGQDERQEAPAVRRPPPPPERTSTPAMSQQDVRTWDRGQPGGPGRNKGNEWGRFGDERGDRGTRDGRDGRGDRGMDRWSSYDRDPRDPRDRNQRNMPVRDPRDKFGRNQSRGDDRRGDRFDDRRGGRGGGRGRGGRGRGGRGGGRGGVGPDPDVFEAVVKLFTGEVAQGAEQPMWRYIDYEGAIQGPFPAKSMIEWFQGGYLSDSAIQVCGTERKVSPPNLPPQDFYMPLGALIFWIRRGHHFSPITVADIQSKKLPEELATLKDSAAKAFEGVNKEKEKAEEKREEKAEKEKEKAEKTASADAKNEGADTGSKPEAERTMSVKRSDVSWAEADECDIIGFSDTVAMLSLSTDK